MTEPSLLTFNAGSSTVKIGIFEIDGATPRRVGKALLDFSDQPLMLHLKEGPTQFDLPLKGTHGEDLSDLIEEALGELGAHFDLDTIMAAGHRIVHGGDIFKGPAELTPDTIERVRGLTDLAPLHQPQALRLIQAMRHLRPKLFQVGSFDTTFHATQADLVRRFAIPRRWHEQGVKRYGFHGLSYRYVAQVLAEKAPHIAKRKVIIAHLGSGASLCAIENGESRDTSMGFSTLDGIPMATRPGALDAGVLLHFLGPRQRSIKEIEEMLYHQSGLLGVSGLSGDIRDLVDDGREYARKAVDLFTLRISGEIGRLAMTIGGLDGLIFTAGIGENQPHIRTEITNRLLWLGAALDDEANERNALTISSTTSRIAIHVIPTDEEQMIAEECVSVLSARA